MARTLAVLPEGPRLSDHISLGVLARTFPLGKIHAVLTATATESHRRRDLPAHVMVYYVIALALYMQVAYQEVLRCLLEALRWALPAEAVVTACGASAISQARTRLGAEPLRRLHDEIVEPVATRGTNGAWYRLWRVVSLDGSTLDVADEGGNEEAFGRPGAGGGKSGYPQLRFVSLVENGTHVLFASRMGAYRTSEVALAQKVLDQLRPGMLCLADRLFFGFKLWKQARARKAELVWRIKKNLRLRCDRRLPDGSYLSQIYPSGANWKKKTNGVQVRVIEYRLDGLAEAEPIYRLITTILDWEMAPANELAALYHQRWEIETAFAEFKVHLRGARIILRSKTPELVRQEFYGFLLAHFAIRKLMHEAAQKGDCDPDELSFLHAVHVVKRQIARYGAIPPSGEGPVP
jgi:Insertion element 4 transposase N-terminal/Transposase DDE domain